MFDPRGGYWMDGHYVPSLLAAIGDVIERHMIDIGFLPDPRREQQELERMVARKVANLADGLGNGDAGSRRLPHCPKCSSPSADPAGRLRPLHQLRLQQVRVISSLTNNTPLPLAGEGCAGLASASELSRSWMRGPRREARSARALSALLDFQQT